ncbi:MAG: hypothetical protein HOH65_01330 [Rhodospirillaceae bacterium]|nr:hypothetical protein [Rhodospirillaceae bacterium]
MQNAVSIDASTLELMEHRAKIFAGIWKEVESEGSKPERVRDVVVMPYEEFAEKVVFGDTGTAEGLVRQLYAGDGFVLKGAFSREFWQGLKNRAAEYAEKTPASFGRILEGAEDFHRYVHADMSERYAAHRLRHDFHFYPWNDDPLGMREECDQRWRVFKVMNGLGPLKGASNTPKDGIVDRYHVFHYPRGGGSIQIHSDPTQNQKTIMISLGTKRGVDYQTGGLFLVDADGNHVDCEPLIDPGDMVTCYAHVHHGVETVDGGEELDWSPKRGRWFLGFYSIDSDYIEERGTIVGINDDDPPTK